MNVTVTSQPIAATVSGAVVSATVTSSSTTVTASGGVGPPGTSGGPLEQLSNVEIVSAQPGDVLRYESNKWRNQPMDLNGGNF
jgi:hypothetical protein